MMAHEERQRQRKQKEIVLPSTTLGERRRGTSYSTLNRLRIADQNYLKSIRTAFDDAQQRYIIKRIHEPKKQVGWKEADDKAEGTPGDEPGGLNTTRNKVHTFLS